MLTRIRSIIAQFFRLKSERRVLLLTGFLLAVYSYFLFKYNNRNARFGGKNKSDSSTTSATLATLRDIRFVIKVLTKYIPWDFLCRHQAWVVRFLLLKHQIPFTVFVGFKKNSIGVIEGHAWTVALGVQVSGFCNPDEYTIQTTYSG